MATTQTGTETGTAIPTETWKLDPVHSSVGFEVKYLVATFAGSFGDIDVTLSSEYGEPRLTGAARVESVQVKDEALNGHLLAPDFFDAERHPEISFVSKSIRPDGDGIAVDGELTIKGTTKPVRAHGSISGPAEHPSGGERLGLELEATVDRTEYGVDWNMELPSGGAALADEVTVTLRATLVKEE